MTSQLIARVDDELLLGVDSLINLGVGSNRSEIVRIALSELIERTQQTEVERQMIAAYQSQPQAQAEIDRAHQAALRMIAVDPCSWSLVEQLSPFSRRLSLRRSPARSARFPPS